MLLSFSVNVELYEETNYIEFSNFVESIESPYSRTRYCRCYNDKGRVWIDVSVTGFCSYPSKDRFIDTRNHFIEALIKTKLDVKSIAITNMYYDFVAQYDADKTDEDVLNLFCNLSAAAPNNICPHLKHETVYPLHSHTSYMVTSLVKVDTPDYERCSEFSPIKCNIIDPHIEECASLMPYRPSYNRLHIGWNVVMYECHISLWDFAEMDYEVIANNNIMNYWSKACTYEDAIKVLSRNSDKALKEVYDITASSRILGLRYQ